VRVGVIPGSVSLVTSDSALTGQKVGYAFNVSVTENPEWAFLGWDAVREADYSTYLAGNRGLASSSLAAITNLLDGSGNETGEASVTALTPEPFYLVPWCVERPKVTDHNMAGFVNRKVTNYPIQIWFSRPLDPGTVNFDSFVLSAETNQGYGGRLLEGTGFTRYYEEPEVNGGIVTIRRKILDLALEGEFKRLNITLTLRKDSIRDTGGVYMGKSGDFTELRYGVGAESYIVQPEVSGVEGALTRNGVLIPEAGRYLKRNGDDRYEVYLLLDYFIDSDYTELDTIRVTEKNGNLSSQVEREYLYSIYSGFEDPSGYTELVDAYESSHSGKEPYILRHEILNHIDGTITLAVQPTDTLGNRYTFAKLEEDQKIVTVVLDTTPPGQVGISSTYNKNAKKLTLTWKNPAALDLDEVELSWTNDELQPPLESISQDYDDSVSLNFLNIEENTVCVFTVTTRDEAGNESKTVMSVDTGDSTPPGPVTGLTVSYDGASRTISLGWTNPGDSDLKEARIVWGIKDHAQNTLIVDAEPGTSGSSPFTLSAGDIQATNTYVFAVKTADESGNVSGGAAKEITLARAPGGLTVSSAASNSVTLSWNTVSGATGYRVYRGAAAAGPYASAGTSQSNSYTITGLSPGTRYYFKVSALINSVEGSHSDYIYGITLPSAPARISALAVSSTSIEVSWDQVTGALGYTLYRSAAPDTGYTYVEALPASASEQTDTGLEPGTTYYYKVSVKTQSGESDMGSYAQAITSPGEPLGLSLSATSATSILLSWDAVQGAVSYNVFRSTVSSGGYTQIGTSGGLSYADTGLTANITYYYKVSAVNSGGEGPQSAYVSVGGAISGLRYVKAGAPGGGLSWADASGDLQAMIDQAYAAKQQGATAAIVHVAAGTYKPQYAPGSTGASIPDSDLAANDLTARDKTFILREGVELRGGYTGDSETTISETERKARFNAEGIPLSEDYRAVLSGDIDNDDSPTAINGNNAYHVVIGLDISGDGKTVLDGFTIKGGSADEDTDNTYACIIVNSTSVYQYAGGGMYNDSSSPVLSNVTIAGNTAGVGGGMINGDLSSPVLSNVTIAGNTASGGGGMSNFSSSPVLTNVTIAGNNAGIGGGMYNFSSSPVLTNVTIAGNNAGDLGGGMSNDPSSSLKIRNSIVWGNSSGIITGSGGGGTPEVYYSIVQGGWPGVGSDNLTSNPRFVSPEPASSAPITTGNYRLTANSPAINAGSGAYYDPAANPNLSAVTTDLDGTARIQKGGIDMGAYESAYDPPGNSSIILTFVDQGEGAFSQESFIIRKTGNPQTQQVTVTGSGYTNPLWFVDGSLKASVDNITINAANYGLGGHSLSLEVETAGGVPWSKAISFTVEN
jgi:fibronectin type 3 domain-containing protein